MPATAGRVRMPADNRLSFSNTLKASEIWKKSVGYDPFPNNNSESFKTLSSPIQIEANSKGLFALARLTGTSPKTTPGACKKCNQIGHLTYQCRNDLIISTLNSKQCSSSSSSSSSSSNSSQSSFSDEDRMEHLDSLRKNVKSSSKTSVKTRHRNSKNKSKRMSTRVSSPSKYYSKKKYHRSHDRGHVSKKKKNPRDEL